MMNPIFECTCIIVASLCCAMQILGGDAALTPIRIYKNGDSSVFAFDKVLGKRLLAVTTQLIKQYGTWIFEHPDQYEKAGSKDNGNLHWNAPFLPKHFANSLIWKGLKKGLKGTGMFDGREFYPYSIHGIMLLRGFSPAVYKAKSEGDVYIRVYLTKGFKKNDYSELQFYDDKGEIYACIHPKYGRVVLWNDTTDFIFKPPSMNVEQGEYSLLIKATTDKEKFLQHNKIHMEAQKEQIEHSKKPFPYTNASSDDVFQMDLTKHINHNFTDSTGRIVAVFDNVVQKEELDTLRKFFIKRNSAYTYGTYDPNPEEPHDNVNWIVKFDPLSITKSRIWSYVIHCLSFLSGENKWYPYDVAMNIIQHAHHTRIHSDCAPNEHEYTFLMYLGPGWNAERYGETIFVEQATSPDGKKPKAGNEKYETLSAVVPKYGRISLFRNIIDHSARPPSPDFLAARYTFVVKVGRSPEIAIAKALRENLDEHIESMPKAKKLQEDIYEGKYDVFDNLKTEKFLREKLEKYKKLSDDNQEQSRSDTFAQLKLKDSI